MQVVILAAGRGTRMGDLTKDTPKPMILLAGKPLIEYTLNALPQQISHVIMVIGSNGEAIQNHLGRTWKNKAVDYVVDDKLDGTAGALWTAKELLSEKFLVLNADDLYDKDDLAEMLQHDTAMGIHLGPPPNTKTFSIQIDEQDRIVGLRRPEAHGEQINIATGAYLLDQRIFQYDPVPIASGKEYGLPQTVMKMAVDLDLRAVRMPQWVQVNTPEDLQRAEKLLTQK